MADVIMMVLLFPVFMASSSAFRHHFLSLLHLDTASASSATSSRPKWYNRFVEYVVALNSRICGFPPAPPTPPPSLSPDPSSSEPPLRWSWGKGWRQSFSPPLSSPSGVASLQPDAVELEVTDPEQLDAMVDQHNSAAYTSDIGPHTMEGTPFRHYARHHGSVFAPKRSTIYTRQPRHF